MSFEHAHTAVVHDVVGEMFLCRYVCPVEIVEVSNKPLLLISYLYT